jgi:hypothetical protein
MLQYMGSKSVKGADKIKFIKMRQSDESIKEKQNYVENIFNELFEKIPTLKLYIETNLADRTKNDSSLLFRPIGQNILFSVLKVSIENNLKEEAIKFFANQDFSVENPIWKKVFYDEETGNLKTDKSLQRYAFQLIAKKIGCKITLSTKDLLVYNNFDFKISDI